MTSETSQARDTWEAALGELQLHVTRPSFETWLKGTVGLSQLDGEFIVGAPNTFVAEMLEQRMFSLIARAVERVSKRPLDVKIEVLPGDASYADERSATWSHGTARDDESNGVTAAAGHRDDDTGSNTSSPLNSGYTFESYIVGKSNELAHAAAAAVARSPGLTYNPLFIYSGVGLGKTHLLHAIGHQVKARGMSLIYATTEDFTNAYIKAIREGTTEDFRGHYRGADVLLLDDVQFLIGKEQTQEGFFHTFNTLHMANRQIVITSDRPISALSLLEDRVRSRLGGGLVVDIQAPDLETRLAILRAKADATGQEFAPDVLQFLAERIHKNIRELEGNLTRVAAYAQLTNSVITVEVVRRAIDDALHPPDRRRVSDSDVISAVATYFDVSLDSLKGRRRDKRTAMTRQVAMYLLRNETPLGLAAIGQVLGGKDHTTVLHACNRISSQINLDPHLRQDILNIRESLT